jgi:hypothetical protein
VSGAPSGWNPCWRASSSFALTIVPSYMRFSSAASLAPKDSISCSSRREVASTASEASRLPELRLGHLQLLASGRELFAGLELPAAVIEPVDRRVELLKLSIRSMPRIGRPASLWH